MALEQDRVQKGGTEYLHKYYQSIPLIPCPLAETTHDACSGVQQACGMLAFMADALNANKADGSSYKCTGAKLTVDL